jgi:2-polyprenyl-6-hydroxyphenyl methylase/3-demethylubiquinone-9 3-methyltransferase
MISLEDYVQLFDEHGGHRCRLFAQSLAAVSGRPRRSSSKDRSATAGKKVLDVGAHWLHQALLFALDGYSVTAADLSDTMNATNVVSTASAHNIRLISYDDLASATAFSALPRRLVRCHRFRRDPRAHYLQPLSPCGGRCIGC